MVNICYEQPVKGLWIIFKYKSLKFRRLTSGRIFWKKIISKSHWMPAMEKVGSAYCRKNKTKQNKTKQNNKKHNQQNKNQNNNKTNISLLVILYSFVTLNAVLFRKLIYSFFRKLYKSLRVFFFFFFFPSNFPSLLASTYNFTLT